jgi:Cys-tRNA(Pro) deacylase
MRRFFYMSVESVVKFFSDRGIEDPTFDLGESGATVELASQTLNVEPAMIAKTLAFRVKDRDVLIVMKGDARVDNRKYKDHFKTKARFIDQEEVAEITGHPVGGVCPFGLKNELDVYIDESLTQFDFVYPAAGSIYRAMKIKPSSIQKLTGAEYVDVCK